MPPTWTDEGIAVAEEIHGASTTSGCSSSRNTSSPSTRSGCSRVGGERHRLPAQGAGARPRRPRRRPPARRRRRDRRRPGAGLPAARPAGRDAARHLTPREREVLALIAEGLTDRGIGQRLLLTPNTVETHVRHILASWASRRHPPTTGGCRRARLLAPRVRAEHETTRFRSPFTSWLATRAFPQKLVSSPGWTRTNNPSVNSRMLCQLSYRGSTAGV